MTIEQGVALWGIFCSAVIATVYFMAYRNPERNAVTRFIQSYLSRNWGGLRSRTPRQSMLLIGFGGVLGVVMGIVFFFREGWWKF